MLTEGLVTMVKVHVLKYAPGDTPTGAADPVDAALPGPTRGSC